MSNATLIAVTQRARQAVADSCGFPPPGIDPYVVDLNERWKLAVLDALDELTRAVLTLGGVVDPAGALGVKPEPRRAPPSA